VHHLEPRVGGTFKMSFRNFTTGNGHSFGGEYIELVPNERLRYTDKFDDPNLPGDIQVTVTLKTVSVGTELNIVQEGLPDMIPPEACYLGWQESLRNLAMLVEPEINQWRISNLAATIATGPAQPATPQTIPASGSGCCHSPGRQSLPSGQLGGFFV
jgi:hypothetical protein